MHPSHLLPGSLHSIMSDFLIIYLLIINKDSFEWFEIYVLGISWCMLQQLIISWQNIATESLSVYTKTIQPETQLIHIISQRGKQQSINWVLFCQQPHDGFVLLSLYFSGVIFFLQLFVFLSFVFWPLSFLSIQKLQ